MAILDFAQIERNNDTRALVNTFDREMLLIDRITNSN